MKTLNPSLKHQALIGLLLGVWAFLFAFFARPFEHGYMDLKVWIRVSVGFSLLTTLSYGLMSVVQKYIFQKLGRWTILLEVVMYFLFFLIYTITTYLYYRGPIIRGIYDFPEFFVEIILNIILIVSPILYFARSFSLRLIPKEKEESEITIKGENQLDILKIAPTELICISNAQNYVEIFYLEDQELKSKLMRSSLKQMQSNLPFLVQVHRSHLINPRHLKSWKDSSTISLTKMELPVSKKYKEQLLNL